MFCRALLIAGVVATAYCLAYGAYLYPWPAAIVGAVILATQLKRHGAALFSHGTARWARPSDLERAGMFGKSGINLGRVVTGRPQFWRSLRELFIWSLPHADVCETFVMSMRKFQPQSNVKEVRINPVHVAVFAPTGVGKGVSLVIPFLLECTDNCIIIDPKGENYRITGNARRKMGHRVVVLDPFKLVTQTPDTFNPLSMIDKDSPLAMDDLRALSKALVVRTGMEHDPYWLDRGEDMITALTGSLFTLPKEYIPSLQGLRELLTNSDYRKQALRRAAASDLWDGMLARVANSVAGLVDKELGGVLSTANRHTTFLDTMPIAESTKTSRFDPAELKKGNMTVYLVLPPEYLRSQSALLRLWIGSMLRACVKAGADERKKVHFVLDESASLGRLEVLDDAVDKYRGYGVRLQFYYQSIGQLKKCWGNDGGDQTLLSNTTQVFFGCNDHSTAEYVSNRLGEETIVVESGGTNGGGSSQQNNRNNDGSLTHSWGWGKNWNEIARRLLKPEEVTALNPRIAVTFHPGVPPICTALVRYYEATGNGRWRRLRIKVEVWLAALSLLALSATVGAWMTVVLNPQWRMR